MGDPCTMWLVLPSHLSTSLCEPSMIEKDGLSNVHGSTQLLGLLDILVDLSPPGGLQDIDACSHQINGPCIQQA